MGIPMYFRLSQWCVLVSLIRPQTCITMVIMLPCLDSTWSNRIQCIDVINDIQEPGIKNISTAVYKIMYIWIYSMLFIVDRKINRTYSPYLFCTLVTQIRLDNNSWYQHKTAAASKFRRSLGRMASSGSSPASPMRDQCSSVLALPGNSSCFFGWSLNFFGGLDGVLVWTCIKECIIWNTITQSCFITIFISCYMYLFIKIVYYRIARIAHFLLVQQFLKHPLAGFDCDAPCSADPWVSLSYGSLASDGFCR